MWVSISIGGLCFALVILICSNELVKKDIEILGWCPERLVLSHAEKVPL